VDSGLRQAVTPSELQHQRKPVSAGGLPILGLEEPRQTEVPVVSNLGRLSFKFSMWTLTAHDPVLKYLEPDHGFGVAGDISCVTTSWCLYPKRLAAEAGWKQQFHLAHPTTVVADRLSTGNWE